ncbi:hypothetical protein CALVIDRAFT_541256 [Calocera viscosa TUFC12733]|uniref:Uncharacterized protein n=1 Tax=Calocera viscosa (strain TUFC12733) TaxID=1330018 RepID=A0A167I208_CALVF|nr:hypothetical protein CALVIDRAFT_541256 [Calocera viscosa TUFC12733]
MAAVSSYPPHSPPAPPSTTTTTKPKARSPSAPTAPTFRPSDAYAHSTTAPRAPSQPTTAHASRSKPILTWLQRKLASARRASSSLPSPTAGVSARLTTPPNQKYNTIGPAGNNGTPLEAYPARRARPLTNGTSTTGGTTGSLSGRISPAPGSDYPPTHESADDDASTRPLPPTSPPSPAPSRHTYSSLSVRSGSTGHPSSQSVRGSSFAISASTKPTTLLSVDSGARAPITAPSIHFSHLPPSSPTPSGNLSVPTTPTQSPPDAAGQGDKLLHQLQKSRAPRYSQPNPARNPDPAEPAQDNASILTLASTTGGGRRGAGSSFYPAYASSRLEGEDGEGEDGSASMRAIKPRSRRGSWGTERTEFTLGTVGTWLGQMDDEPGERGDGDGDSGSVPIGHSGEQDEEPEESMGGGRHDEPEDSFSSHGQEGEEHTPTEGTVEGRPAEAEAEVVEPVDSLSGASTKSIFGSARGMGADSLLSRTGSGTGGSQGSLGVPGSGGEMELELDTPVPRGRELEEV